MGRLAIFPGTFDPLTLGHEHLIQRAASIFGRVTVLVANNTGKKPMMSQADRIRSIELALGGLKGVDVSGFEGLLVDYLSEIKDTMVVVRGVRSVNDYLYEHDRSMMNQAMSASVETLFIPASPQFSSLSSTLVREILMLKGDASKFVSSSMLVFLQEYYGA